MSSPRSARRKSSIATQLSSPEFIDRLYNIGHSISLFSYEHAKEPPSIADDALVLVQSPGTDSRLGIRAACVELFEDGTLVFDSNVTGLAEREHSCNRMGISQIAAEDVEAALARDFKIDPYKRHQRFFWNSALRNVGYRSLARNPQPQESITMNTTKQENPAIAFKARRPIDRTGLTLPATEVERASHA